MIAEFQRRGWRFALQFGMKGPVYTITGDFHGTITAWPPVRLDEDHSSVMDDINRVYGEFLEIQGQVGHA